MVSNQTSEPEIEPVTEPEIEPGTGEGDDDADSPKGGGVSVRSSDRIRKRPNTYTRFVYSKRSSGNANASNKTKSRTSAASIAKKIQNNGVVRLDWFLFECMLKFVELGVNVVSFMVMCAIVSKSG